LIIGGKLGVGLETVVSVAVGVWSGISTGVEVDVVVGIGVVPGVRIVLGVGLRREPGPGLIGRTGWKYWVWPSSTRVAFLVSTAPVVACGVSLDCAVAEANGVTDESGVAVGETIGASPADAEGVGEIVAVGDILLFLRCFGVAVGRTKSFFNLSPNDSSCSCVPRTTPALIAIVIAITKRKRSFLFT
jgi:hypothetical protein